MRQVDYVEQCIDVQFLQSERMMQLSQPQIFCGKSIIKNHTMYRIPIGYNTLIIKLP